jgi:GTP-binding protein
MPARFVTSAATYEKLPDLGLPEYAFVGRSNVGKSSLLNCLFQRNKLVRASKTPGRTQLLNLFVLDERHAFVDLPGYGYAKLSKSQRGQLSNMIRNYITQRETLCGVVMLVDARREGSTDSDRATMEWIRERGRPLLIAVTKSDLVPKNQRLHHLRKIERELGVPEGCAMLVSSKTGEGRDELLQRLTEGVDAP